MEKEEVLACAVKMLLAEDELSAEEMLSCNYPFALPKKQNRSFSEKQKLAIYFRDGFIDRYNGKKLVNPGLLKCFSIYFPKTFPYHPHWKMTECHVAYWELLPTVDHVVPIARGGEDNEQNIITTSMLNNSIKSNWQLQELGWTLREAGNLADWDGLTSQFLELVRKNSELLEDSYIKRWALASQDLLNKSKCTG